MSNIKVPEGMLQAADEAISKTRGYGRDLTGGQVRDVVLYAALLWLSENPIAPTKEQVRELVGIAPLSQARQEYSATIFCMEEWQRRMFLAPEQETAKDGTVVWEASGRPSGVWYKGEVLNTNIPSPSKEYIDLLFCTDVREHGRTMTANERIEEAFRRGQKEGTK